MKIALLHDHLNQAGGAERVLYVLSQIFPQAPIYTLLYNKKLIRGFENFDIRTSFLQKMPLAKNHLKWYLPLMPTAVEELDLSGFDIVLSSASALIKGVITHPNTLHICYCHTPTRYLWSDTHQYKKDLNAGLLIKKVLPYFLNQLRTWDQLAAQRVDRYIANSQFVAQRIKNYYNRESTVIYPPVDTENFYISENVKNYFLIISRLRPYKKVDLVIKAFNKLKMPLKIIGTGEEEKALRAMANSNIEFVGQVTEQQKRQYLAECQALIHPQEEDFGITAIEAMASGRPVIAYGAGGALETVIEGFSGKIFPEQSWECLIDAIIKFKSEEYTPAAIKEYARQYDVKNFQQKIKEYIETEYDKFNKQTISNESAKCRRQNI